MVMQVSWRPARKTLEGKASFSSDLSYIYIDKPHREMLAHNCLLQEMFKEFKAILFILKQAQGLFLLLLCVLYACVVLGVL